MSPLPPSAAASALPRVREIGLDAPWRWLQRGWMDLARTPGLSLAHGLLVALFGAMLLTWGRHQFWWLAGAFSGFLMMAPVLATGLYALSRAHARGLPADAALVWHLWTRWRDPQGRPDTRRVRFGLLLALAGTGWVLTSAALITLWAPEPVREPLDFLRVVVLQPQGLLFEAWLMLGGVLAAPVFASSVVALPLLIDRPVSVLDAVLTSWRCVLANPAPMALWAALLMALSLFGLFTALLGLAVILPWLGHASWHAYADLVDPGDMPAEPAPWKP